MGKQTWADNVDANGVAYDTVGDNIREGAKDAESVVKALQSPDITFDMQAVMNVLPFMDSTKKIVKFTITPSSGKWISNELEFTATASDSISFNTTCYGLLVGEIKRVADISNINKLHFFRSAYPLNTSKLSLKFLEPLDPSDNGNVIITLYLCTDK